MTNLLSEIFQKITNNTVQSSEDNLTHTALGSNPVRLERRDWRGEHQHDISGTSQARPGQARPNIELYYTL